MTMISMYRLRVYLYKYLQCPVCQVDLEDPVANKQVMDHWVEYLVIHGLLICHRLLKFLLDKQFQHYATLMTDFMLDDHYRAVSITSISVQIFTVPTLARLLIAEENLLSVIINSFMVSCREKIKDDGRLSFDKNIRAVSPFKRAWYMLYDLRYALINKPTPEEWNDKLRKNFIKGVKSLLELLIAMQEMDAVTRQTGHHLEFEPEWENAFNLQLKLDDNIALLLEWCSSDKEVLIEAYRAALEALNHCTTKPIKRTAVEVAGCAAQVIKYDVSSQPVSVHLPVTRLIAGLHVHLEKFGLSFDSDDFNIHGKIDPVKLIEPTLRCQVLIAQTQAGMWRRNGYSLLNQIFFYNNVKCRSQMFDKDITMLQVGASIIENNEFIIHLLNKFGLTGWVKPEFDDLRGQEDSVRQTVMLAEEFLNLLIILLSERYTPGVGKVDADDVVRREIIHQLCLAPMAHSELTKALPEDYNHETGIEENVDGVADFIKPIGTGKGKYELKPVYYKDFNPYFYHYSRSEQSKAEEAQLKRKKSANNDQALPPPVPPPLTSLFKPLANLLQCDVMIHIMELVLRRTGAQWSRSWSEAQFEKVLHLVGLALHEQRKALNEDNSSFDFLKKATNSASTSSILSLLEGLVNNTKITHDTQNDLLAWIVKNFAEVLKLKNASESMDTVESPSTFPGKKLQSEKKKKAELAAKRREKIMAQMSSMQRNFIKENAELFEETSSEIPRTSSEMDLSDHGCLSFLVCLGKHKSSPPSTAPYSLTCILCQEDQEITYGGRAMVLAAFIQQSTALSQSRGKIIEDGEGHDPLFMPSDLFVGTHTGSCGHAMHSDCWQRFFDAILAKERRRPLRFRQKFSYNMEKNEYLCPLCECLSNTVIPVVPALSSLTSAASAKKEADISFNDWLDGIQKTVQNSVKEKLDLESQEESLMFIPCPVRTITKMMAESVAKNFLLLWEYVNDDASGNFSEGMREMLKKFSRDIYQVGLNTNPDDDNWRVPLMAWNTCAYTIQVAEQCQKEEEKPLFGSLPARQVDCLNSLVKFAAVCGQVMNPEVVKQQCIRALTALIPDGTGKTNKDSLCILDIDMFHYLVQLVVNLPILYSEGQSAILSALPTGGLNDEYCLHICYIAHLVQILLLYEYSPSDSMDVESEHDDEGMKLLKVLNKLKVKAGMSTENSPSPWQLLQYVKKASLPFLRCAAIFFHHITGVLPSDSLQEDNSETYHFEDLCTYLSLPHSISSLLENRGDVLEALITSWCISDTLKERLSASSQKIVRYPLAITRLKQLPDDYSELINQVSRFTCPKSEGDESRAPTMCLVCGKILCSQSYCCQTELNGETVGAATEHTHTCGSGVGLFLRVRECQILLLAGKSKGCFVSPPYIDNYGETDQGLRRGNPLHLCKERYKQLLKLWYNHSIPETIAHTLESHTNLLDVEWQHL